MDAKKIISFNSNEHENIFINYLKKKKYDIFNINSKISYKNIESLEQYELVLFDSRLKWDDKFKILDWIRQKNFKIPIIVFLGTNYIELDKYYKYCISEYIDITLSKLEFYKCFKKALRKRDMIYLHYYHIGEMYHLQSNYKRAVKLYKNSLKINDRFINSYISMFYIYIKQKDYSRAKKIFKKMEKLNSPSFIILNLKIYLEYLNRNYEKVIYLVNKMENNEQIYDSNVYKYQLYSYMRLKNIISVFKVFLKLWFKNISFKKSLINTIKIHKNLGHYSRLYQASKNMKKIFPDNDFVTRSYILSLIKKGKMNKAMKFVNKNKKYRRYFSYIIKKDGLS